MGVSQGTMDAFYANPNLTPTDKIVIVKVMESLGPVGGRELYIAGAANASSVEMGFFYRHQAMLIQQYSKKVSPVRGFARVGGAPMLHDGEWNRQHSSRRLSQLERASRRYCRPAPPAAESSGSPETRARWPPLSSRRSAGRSYLRPALGSGLMGSLPAGIDAR